MPHLVVLYTGQLDAEVDMSSLCRRLADTMLEVRDDNGKAVFPAGGIRVLAYPAAHFAVADGGGAGLAAGPPGGQSREGAGIAPDDYGFVYLNLRMGYGRPATAVQRAGEMLAAQARDFFAALFASRRIGVTLQIDEGKEVFDAKHSNLHPLFPPRPPPGDAQ